MRRRDREQNSEEFFSAVFERAEVIFLAFRNGEFPYCLPFNFAREGGIIYIHSARDGQKLDCIRADGHVAFSLAIDMEIDRHNSTTYYKSVCGLGMASIVQDNREKRHALELIGSRYNAKCRMPATDSDAGRVAIIRIDIGALSGKACLPGA